ncbi:12349_t:CDS:2 [Dentiscutata erythropus]|uniref:12349_t:CDS:1 n=1 Tax=Dentiscutata erythropus TaxID=1348616 RepID=A0A9N9JNQ3_9GLOM|nr:12349_t:CDS:2 [Dentiscutata erythropus]
MAKTRGGKTTNNKSNKPAHAPFVPMNFNNNNYTNYTRSLYNINPELIHNSSSNVSIQSNFINPNLTYNTYSSSKNFNRLQVSYNNTNNFEDRSMISKNSVISEQQHRSLSQATTMSLDEHTLVNSYNTANTAIQRLDNNSKELNFSNEQLLVNWLYTWPDLIMQVQNLTASLPNKNIAALAKDLLVKNCDPTDENIEQFVAGKVWQQKLSKYLEASNFSEFKKSQSLLKSLENFIAKSLKIHVDYQVVVHNKEKLFYSKNILTKIKKLNQLTLYIIIPLASQRNCVNELDLNQIDIESSDNE